MSQMRRDRLVAGFTEPQPYTMEAADSAPTSGGVHVVLDNGAVVHVGWTGNLRRRLRQHLTGSRKSSMLHDQIAGLLDLPGSTATAADVADWLSRRTVRWLVTDDPRTTAEELVAALMPCFNRRVPRSRRAADDQPNRSPASPVLSPAA
jgi:hypothetical protein